MSSRLTQLGAVFIAAAFTISPARAEPKPVGAEARVAGRIGDMVHAVHSSGYQFRVALSGLSYDGRVDRTLVEEKEDGGFTIWLALRDVVLTIGSTSISGRPGSASCGPLDIQLGHQRDLWVAYDFESYQAAGEPALKLAGTRFALPHDNWSVGSPAWIRTSGFGMSKTKIINGLRGGLVNNKEQIEQRLIAIAPSMLARVAPIAGDAPANHRNIAGAVQRLLTIAGYLPIKPEASLAATGIEG